MRTFLSIAILLISVTAKCQQTVSEHNKLFVDSLIEMYKTKSQCSLTNSTLSKGKKKRRLDTKLLNFLNRFYTCEETANDITKILKREFHQAEWRNDQINHLDSFTIYKGLVRSNGNLEGSVAYIVNNNRILATRISIRIRSSLDCITKYDREIPDLFYLSEFVSDKITFPFEVAGWTEVFNSKIHISEPLPNKLSIQVLQLLSLN